MVSVRGYILTYHSFYQSVDPKATSVVCLVEFAETGHGYRQSIAQPAEEMQLVQQGVIVKIELPDDPPVRASRLHQPCSGIGKELPPRSPKRSAQEH